MQLGTSTLIIMVITAIALPVVIIKLPEDYFARDPSDAQMSTKTSSLAWTALMLLKNVLGVLMILAGIIMLVLPGQGTLSILIGVALTDFPGKAKLERRLVSQPSVLAALNKVRALAGKRPLRVTTEPGDAT